MFPESARSGSFPALCQELEFQSLPFQELGSPYRASDSRSPELELLCPAVPFLVWMSIRACSWCPDQYSSLSGYSWSQC